MAQSRRPAAARTPTFASTSRARLGDRTVARRTIQTLSLHGTGRRHAGRAHARPDLVRAGTHEGWLTQLLLDAPRRSGRDRGMSRAHASRLERARSGDSSPRFDLRTHRRAPIKSRSRSGDGPGGRRKGRMGREKGVSHRSTTVTHGHQRSHSKTRRHTGVMPVGPGLSVEGARGFDSPQLHRARKHDLPGVFGTSRGPADFRAIRSRIMTRTSRERHATGCSHLRPNQEAPGQ